MSGVDLYSNNTAFIKSQQTIKTDAGFSGGTPQNITISSVDTNYTLMDIRSQENYNNASNNDASFNSCIFSLTTANNLQMDKRSTVSRPESKFIIDIKEYYPNHIRRNTFHSAASVALTGSETYYDFDISGNPVVNIGKCEVRSHGFEIDQGVICGGAVLSAELINVNTLRVYLQNAAGAATLDVKAQVMEFWQ